MFCFVVYVSGLCEDQSGDTFSGGDTFFRRVANRASLQA